MSAPEITEEQMALLLQASREFAFEQMAAGKRLLPFGTRVKPAIYAATRAAIASEAV